MICPKCHREMGDELSCDFCGFTFLLPKKAEEKVSVDKNITENKPIDVPAEPSAEINGFGEVYHAPTPEALKRNPSGPIDPVNFDSFYDLDPEYDMVFTYQYIFMLVLSFIPVVSLIVNIIWACRSKVSRNRANFAVAVLFLKAVALFFIVGAAVCYFMITENWPFFLFG